MIMEKEMERPVSRLGRKAKGPRRVVLVHVVGSRSCGARARVAAGLLTCATLDHAFSCI